MKLFDPRNPHYKRNMAFGVKHSNSGLYLNRTKEELKDGFERAIRRVPSKYKKFARAIFKFRVEEPCGEHQVYKAVSQELNIHTSTYYEWIKELTKDMEALNERSRFYAFKSVAKRVKKS